MDFEKILYDSSKFLAVEIARQLTENPHFLENAVNTAFKNINQISARATNVIEIFDQQTPDAIKPYLGKIINLLKNFKYDGQTRSFLKLLTRHLDDLNDEEQGLLFEICLKYIINTKQPVAVRYYAIEISGLFAKKYPELENEVISTVEIALNEGSAAFKAQAKEMYKSLKKTKQNIQ